MQITLQEKPARLRPISGKKQTYHIRTWGCQMNVDDSEQMALLLQGLGYEQAADPEQADLILLNTCSVREKPEQKLRSELGLLRLLKKQNPELSLGVTGCMAQREGDNIQKWAPYVDLVVGTGNVDRIPELVSNVVRERQP